VPVKFIGADGSGTTAGAICSILYAISINARVMNASGGDTACSQALHDAIALADYHDALYVAAAGNDSVNNDTTRHYPASYDLPNVISVVATDAPDGTALAPARSVGPAGTSIVVTTATSLVHDPARSPPGIWGAATVAVTSP